MKLPIRLPHAYLFLCLTALTVGCSSGSGNSSNQTPPVVTPVITSISPSSIPAGSSAVTLTVNGSGFQTSTTLQVNGAAVASTYVSSSQMTATILANLLATGASLQITANNSSATSSAVTLTVNNPAPVITSFSPASEPLGTPASSINVAGTGFVSTTAIQVNGSSRVTTYVSSTQVTVALTTADFATAGSLSLTAVNPTPGGGTSPAASLSVLNPAPTITSFSPTSEITGSAASSINVTGTGFVSTTTIQVNGSSRVTTYVSSTQVTVALTAADFATAGSVSLTAVNPTPGGGTSAAASVPVLNPVPGAIGLAPSIVPAAPPTPSVISVTGSNFVSNSTVQINGAARTTTFVSATQLSFTLLAADQASISNLTVTVSTPTPGGGTSTSATLRVQAATSTPVISTVSPTSFIINTATGIAVYGSNFTTSSVILWNGSPLTTSATPFPPSPGAYYLTASVPSSLLSALGTATVQVSVPTAFTPSNTVTVGITNPPVPTISSLSPAGAPLGTTTTITVAGGGFTPNSTVQMDGVTLSTTYAGSTRLTAVVPGSMVGLLGTHSVTVTTPAPGGGTSSAATFMAYVGIQTNAMAMNPANGLLYVSVPSTAGPPYGNSIVSVDPATGILGTPIYVGSEPDKLAISADGSTLWVGLDGASAVRAVNLTTGVAGMQFSFGDNTGVYQYPPVVHAIAVLPGTTTSIAVSVTTNGGIYEDRLTIYDNGVPRANSLPLETLETLPAIFVNPTSPEIYATSFETGYQVLSYDASGLSNLAGNTGTSNLNAPYGTAVQIDNGRAYLDTGVVLGAETGTLLGTFYSSGTTVATGPMVSDSTLGKNFILVNAGNASAAIEAFNESDFTRSVANTIPVGGMVSGYKYGAGDSSDTELNGNNPVDTMVRWGANGLAFRASNGVFSLRSNLVQDLSATNADLGVTVNAPTTAVAGTSFTAVATITNNGLSSASSVTLSQTIPANVSLISITSSQGTCTTLSPVRCSLGSLANGASAMVTLDFQALSSGAADLSTSVAADQNDPVTTNNSVTASVNITGSQYALVPAISALSPNAALSGSSDLTLTVTGSNFVSNSVIYCGSTALSTTYVSSTQLTANLPAAQMTTLGWLAITVNSPAPGGGVSGTLPFSVYSIVSLSANHVLYDPYSRLLYASVSSAATQVTGNTIVTINPATGTLGTPAAAGSQPGAMALTQDGAYLYVDQIGSSSVGRYNMAAQSLDFSFPLGGVYTGTSGMRDIAALPGTDNTVAIDVGENYGVGIWDVDPVHQTGTLRGSVIGPDAGSSLQFLDASDLFTFDIDTTAATLDKYTVSGTGLSGNNNSTGYTLNSFSAFKIRGGKAYADAGGVADPTVTPAASVGVFLSPSANTTDSYYNTNGQLTEPDISLGQSFFASNVSVLGPSYEVLLQSFDQSSYRYSSSVTLPTVASAQNGTPPIYIDFTRWGQDGLALLTSAGQIILMRGAFVVPQMLNQNTAATLTSASTLTHGSGNATLTLTGSNFIPGTAALWNGSYRTTSITDPTHLTVALPADDLTSTGSANVTVVNPGAPSSNSLAVPIN